jgi:two-component system invasion response regulator UvrY
MINYRFKADGMQKIKILIADDHALLRESWAFILNNDHRFTVIAESGNGNEAVELACRLRPDIITMDINLPGLNGFKATELILNLVPGSKILAVSLHTQPSYARKMLEKGAKGYVTKNSPADELKKALVEIYNGKNYVCTEIKNIFFEQSVSGTQGSDLDRLSEREKEIVRHIQKGSSTKEIGSTLKISARTVEVHRNNVLKKLKLKNAAALVNFINNKPDFID